MCFATFEALCRGRCCLSVASCVLLHTSLGLDLDLAIPDQLLVEEAEEAGARPEFWVQVW